MTSNSTQGPWKIIAAIAFFLAVLFLFLPYLWRTTENVAVMLVAILLLVPLVRTVSEYLLADAPPPHAIKALLRGYGLSLFALLHELMALLLYLPFILFRMVALLAGIMLFAFGVGLLLYILQIYGGLQIGKTFAPEEWRDIVAGTGYAFAVELGCLALLKLEQRYKEPVLDAYARFYQAGVAALTRWLS